MFDRESLIEIASGERRGLSASLIRGCAWCLSQIYRLAIRFRNRQFNAGRKVTRIEIPVISIGNLTTGGTGKSPLVIWIAQFLRHHGKRVAVLSRGYGAKANQTSDEALELEQRLNDVPHLQNPDRVASARIAIDELDMQTLVLDDAFQHRRIGRDLDIVLIDCTRPFGFGYLLPRGLLREPLSELKRADLVVLSRCDQVPQSEVEDIESRVRMFTNSPIAKIISRASHLLQANGKTTSLESLRTQKSYAFCGIGNPENFWATLEHLDFNIRGSLPFPDHHNYDREDINRISEAAKRCQAEAIFCTHKDLVKIGVNELGGVPVYALIIETEFIHGQDEIEAAILKALKE